jgi:ACT domain-containing protein
VRDHLILHISKINTTKEMFDALKKLFVSNNTNRVITLKHQLQNVKMAKEDTVATFFMKISEIRDQLGAIGEIISDRELVMLTLNGVPSHWEPFI